MPSRYRKLTVSWHNSADGKFDPIAALTSLATAAGLVVRAGKGKNPDRQSLRVDTAESSPVVSPEEKEARKNALRNFRKLIRANPKLAAKIVNMSPEEIAAALNPRTARP